MTARGVSGDDEVREQQARAPRGEHEPQHGPGDREQKTLDQQQTNDLPAAGTHRHAQRQLTLPRRAPRDEQIGDVGADDEQHAAGDRHQDQQRLGDRFAET